MFGRHNALVQRQDFPEAQSSQPDDTGYVMSDAERSAREYSQHAACRSQNRVRCFACCALRAVLCVQCFACGALRAVLCVQLCNGSRLMLQPLLICPDPAPPVSASPSPISTPSQTSNLGSGNLPRAVYTIAIARYELPTASRGTITPINRMVA